MGRRADSVPEGAPMGEPEMGRCTATAFGLSISFALAEGVLYKFHADARRLFSNACTVIEYHCLIRLTPPQRLARLLPHICRQAALRAFDVIVTKYVGELVIN